MKNPVVECYLANRDVFPELSALEWLRMALEERAEFHESPAWDWTQAEVAEASDLFMHPVFGGV